MNQEFVLHLFIVCRMKIYLLMKIMFTLFLCSNSHYKKQTLTIIGRMYKVNLHQYDLVEFVNNHWAISPSFFFPY